MGDDDWVESEPVVFTETFVHSRYRGQYRDSRPSNEYPNRSNRGAYKHNLHNRNFMGGNDDRSGTWGRANENASNSRNMADNSSYQSNTIVLEVPSDKVGRIIGRGGSKIRELQDETSTKIQVSRERNGDINTVSISGSEECAEKCKSLIEDLIYDKPTMIEETKTDFISYNSKNSSQVPVIDWDALNEQYEEAQRIKWAKCPPLKKDFYFEDPAVANMDPNYVAQFRKKNNNIIVSHVFGGEDRIPNPVETFEQAFQHYPEILTEIRKQKFQNPSPIQSQAWPVLLQGKDLIGIAQTGTGKTLAFLLPALIHIDGQLVPRSQRGGANVLVLAPTRELALQIEMEVKKYSYKGIKCVCLYGGASRREQKSVVSSGIEIIIATPGRLNDFIAAKLVDLNSITYLILDEADRMLDMGFEPQIRKVMLDIRPDRQTVMTSATWPPGVRKLAERYMTNPVQIFVGSLDLAAVHSVTQTVIIIDEAEKREYLFDFLYNLSEDDKVIVFVGKKSLADDISSDLAIKNIVCQSIHGDREQSDREQALLDLKSGDVRILVATDVASRGIDIEDVTKVFNFDFPRNIEEYVHRVGRTGRAGKTGEAISLFTRADWASAGELISILEEACQAVPVELLGMKDRYSAWRERKEEERKEAGRITGHRGRGRGGFRRDRW